LFALDSRDSRDREVYLWTIVQSIKALAFVVVLRVVAIPMAMEIVTTTTIDRPWLQGVV